MHMRYFSVVAAVLAAGIVTAQETPAFDTEASAEGEALSPSVREAVQTMLPLDPSEIRTIRDKGREVRKAREEVLLPATAEASAMMVSLEPGSPTPRITLARGFSVAMEITDSTGAPWPIIEAREGNGDILSVQIGSSAEDGIHSNVLMLTPARDYGATNIMLLLDGETTPVSLIAIVDDPGDTLIDRYALLIDKRGPLARPLVQPFSRLSVTDDLLKALSGISPSTEAQALVDVPLPDGTTIWQTDKQMWVRTRSSLISPSPIGQVSKGEYTAYKAGYMPSIVLDIGGTLQTVSLR